MDLKKKYKGEFAEKTVFLDIDGVLNVRHWHEKGHSFIDEDKIRLLSDFVTETKAKVVLSTSWREVYFDDMFSSTPGNVIYDARQIFEKHSIPVVGHTPSLGRREAEIGVYVGDYDLARWVIFDDKPLVIGNFVQVDGDVGLTEKDIEKARQFLEYDIKAEPPRKIDQNAGKEAYDFLTRYDVLADPYRQPELVQRYLSQSSMNG